MKKIWILLLIASSMTACLDEIEIQNPDRPDDGIVVQGRIVLGQPSLLYCKVERLFSTLPISIRP
ncbi:MAG: hypothetical protein R2795_09210 [Saprospiraceae bacterium]